MGREGRNVIHLGHTDVSFPTGPPLLWKGTEGTFFYLFFFFLFNNNRTCVSKKSLPHRCVKTVMPQLLGLSCVTHRGLLALGSGVFARYLEKPAGRRVFCLSFLIFFTFQTYFAFCLYCASSQIYWQAVVRASWQQPKKLWGPCKLFSSQGSCPITAVGGPSQWHPTSSQASQSYSPAMTWDALGAEDRPRMQYT